MGGEKRNLIQSRATVALAQAKGILEENYILADVAILTFNSSIVEYLTETCAMSETSWLPTEIHPYTTPGLVRTGSYRGTKLAVLVPPMGASPMSSIIEDLLTCGVKAVFLVCPAWSLGKPVEFGDLIIPAFSRGLDGTSLHYGNTEGYVEADRHIVEVIAAACEQRGAKHHVGGNATCEALYRISAEMLESFKAHDCLTMENGEANTLFAMAHELDFIAGILFQPYIDLTRGWNPDVFDERFRDTCILQAKIMLDVIEMLQRDV